ncbi:MAG TPA: heavy metal translocating P-type ATPase [Treponemataceae bacterium]|nr:heavy metal translocating P-type ATPase [Treponemataceae bacterium]
MGCACGHCGTECPAEKRTDSPVGKRATLEVRLLAARFTLAAILFALAVILGVAFPSLASSAPYLTRGIFILSWLVAGYRVALNSLRNIRRGEVFDENFLMTVATVGAFAIGQWSEGAAVMLFYNLGEMVQESAVNRSRRSIADLMDVRPDSARLDADGSVVSPQAVPVGTLIRVLPGEKVPLDGSVVGGSSCFDTSRLTGESAPRDVGPGSEALAGFVNGSGLLVIRTTAAYEKTAAAKMLALIEGAQNRKARAEKLITTFARVYTPIVTIGAVLLALVPPVVLCLAGAGPALGWSAFSPWVSRALVFLVISCPCAFVISVPLGFFGGIGGAARAGILVKGADFIDALAKAKAVVFDKTGTLTRGSFAVTRLEPASGVEPRDLLALAASSEANSTHPVAVAIGEYAKREGVIVDADSIADYEEHAGYGLSLSLAGSAVIAGSRRLMESRGVSGLPDKGSDAGTVVEFARDGRYVGRVLLGDEPKEESALAVRSLRALGVADVVMLTGDGESAAGSVARAVGIAEYRSCVLPHEKVSLFEAVSDRVRAAHRGGTTLFVGDGINDAPVLARADAGIAMGAMGSDAAIEAADVVLMNDSPLLVAEAIRSARWTRRIVAENIVLSFAIKLGFLALGAFGFATLWEAVFADVGVALLATLNSLRARRIPQARGRAERRV